MLVLLVALVFAALLLGSWTIQTVDRYLQTATSVRGLRFDIGDITWEDSPRRLHLDLGITNEGALDVYLDHTRFSVYIAGNYVATNTDTDISKTLAPQEDIVLPYVFTLRPFFADALRDGLSETGAVWALRGVIWVDVDGLRSDIPLVVRKEVTR